MAMPLFKLESNPVMNMQESSAILDIAEKILGSFVHSNNDFPRSRKTEIW